MHPALELLPMPPNHEFVQFGNRFGVLADLLLGCRVEDGEPSINVPFVGVDAQGDVHLYVLNTAYPPGKLPWELLVGLPCGSHTQEGCVSDSLGICGDAVVVLAGEVDMRGSEAGEDLFDKLEAFVRGSMLDDDLYGTLCY